MGVLTVGGVTRFNPLHTLQMIILKNATLFCFLFLTHAVTPNMAKLCLAELILSGCVITFNIRVNSLFIYYETLS